MNKHISTYTLDELINENMQDKEFAKHFRYQKFLSNIAQKVYELRKKAGLTQTQLAELVQTSQPVIARLESGEDTTRTPSLSTLYRIAEAVGMDVNIDFTQSRAR
jgi:DNA-binding XRE family transcriptional regulator